VYERGRLLRMARVLGRRPQRGNIREANCSNAITGRPDSIVVRSVQTSEQQNDDEALRAVAVMEQGIVVDLDRATALEAARLSIQHAIAMADSVMLATAHRHRAMLWTQDPDFDGLPGVRNPAEQ